jgi:hypothetical protein
MEGLTNVVTPLMFVNFHDFLIVSFLSFFVVRTPVVFATPSCVPVNS